MAFDTEGNAKGFASSGSDGYLAGVLDAMFGVRLVIRAIVNPAGGRGAARSPARPAGDDHGGAGGRAGPGPGPAGPHPARPHDAGPDADGRPHTRPGGHAAPRPRPDRPRPGPRPGAW